jgi:isopentenyl-diphosphate delta-isomerase type 1
MAELVVLVDENNNQIDVREKNSVHTTDTPLHRGFSLFLFNSRKEILLTQRVDSKKTFPGYWSNTVCGHPVPNETVIDAAKRRLKQELGITASEIKEIIQYRYRFADKNGIVENEICPIIYAKSNAYPAMNPMEVKNYQWMKWSVFLAEIDSSSEKYTPWSREEAVLVEEYFRKLKVLPA